MSRREWFRTVSVGVLSGVLGVLSGRTKIFPIESRNGYCVQLRVPTVISYLNTVTCIECPQCNVIGTLRRYGAIEDVPERWLCKWCGWYWSEELGERRCVPDPAICAWNFIENVPNPPKTPRERWAEQHEYLIHIMGTDGKPEQTPAEACTR